MQLYDEMFFKIVVSLIAFTLGMIAWIIRNFVTNMKDESKEFRQSLADNVRDHGDIRIVLTKLDSKLPDIEQCEQDLKDLRSTDNKQWAKINAHEVKITHLEKKKAV